MFSKCLRIVSCRFEKMHAQVFEVCCRCVLGIWDQQAALLLQNAKVLSYFSYLVSSCQEFKEMLYQLTNHAQNPKIINPNFKVLSNSLCFFNISAALQPYIEFTLKSREPKLMEKYLMMLVQRLNIPRENHGQSFFVDLVRYCMGCEQYELKAKLLLTMTCLKQVKDQFWLSQVMISIFYEWITYDSFIPEQVVKLQLGWALISQREEPKLAIQSLDFLLSLVKQFSPGNEKTETSVRLAFEQFRGSIQIFITALAQLDSKLAQKLHDFLHKSPQIRNSQNKKNIIPPQVSPMRSMSRQERSSSFQAEESKSILIEISYKFREAAHSKQKQIQVLDQLARSSEFLEQDSIRLIANQMKKGDQMADLISFSQILEDPGQYLNYPSTALFDLIFHKSERKFQREFVFLQKLFCFLAEDQGQFCTYFLLYSLIRAKTIAKKEVRFLFLKLKEQMIHSAKKNTKEIIKHIIQELIGDYSLRALDSFILILAQIQPQVCTDFDLFLNAVLECASSPTIVQLAFLIKLGELALFEKTLLSIMKRSLKESVSHQQHLWQLINAHHTGSLKIKDDLLKCVVHILSSEIIMEDENPEKAAIFTLNAVTLIEKFRRERGKTFSLQAIADIKESFPLFYKAIKLIIS